ncbi:CC chemokine family protein [Turkeypox virus]|uniref:CC chemokine family protein n=1 Tax=Turkeypox virus TaxID=336486 RepID=A0A0M5HU02_9POXV|nr:CC chemokine family protein [Turkeypox virus]ALA62433.1 CC chemokine family protein [Turkeypox virus]
MMEYTVSYWLVISVIAYSWYYNVSGYECRDDCCNGRFGTVPAPWNVTDCIQTGPPKCPDSGFLLTTYDNKTFCIRGDETNRGNYPQTIGAIFSNCTALNTGKNRLISTSKLSYVGRV